MIYNNTVLLCNNDTVLIADTAYNSNKIKKLKIEQLLTGTNNCNTFHWGAMKTLGSLAILIQKI